MISDEERREVARRLRAVPVWTLAGIDGDRNRREWKMVPLKKLSHAVGVDHDGNNDVEGHLNVLSCLADLIEPSCDRDALLEQVEELEKCAWYFGLDFDEDEPLRDRLKEASEAFAESSRRIREALGVDE